LVITPFIYIFLIWTFIYAAIKIGKRGQIFFFAKQKINPSPFSFPASSEPFLFSICLSLPILLFFVINGYSHRILVHWPDIGYLAAFPIMGYAADLLAQKEKDKAEKGTDLFYFHSKKRANAIGSKKINKSVPFSFSKYYVYFALFSGFFLSFVLYNQIYYNSIPIGKIIRYIDKEKSLKKGGIFKVIPHIPGKPSTADVTNDLFGWRHSAEYIGIVYKGYEAAYRPLFILTHHYAIADELVYYGGYKPAVNIYNISGFLNQYDLWQNLNKINGENALFVMDNKYMINPVQKYAPFFKSIKKIGRFDIYVKFRPVRTYYLYLMKDFNAKKAVKYLRYKSRMY
ncbi:MAG: hypothetical protein ACYCUT_10485, partial [bacterium]